MEALKEGSKAPDFRLASSTGGELSLHQLTGRSVVLYFYPKDDTSGCTREAIAFRDADGELRALGAVVLGVSKDSLSSHQQFMDKHQLNFALLSDPEGQAVTAYQAWKPGAEGKSINRSTFLIDPERRIRKIWRGVKVDGHVEEVLATLRAIEHESR